MPEHSEGLHKKVSSIFSGVPIPKSNGLLQASDAPEPDHTECAPSKPDHTPPEPSARLTQTHDAPHTQKSISPPPKPPSSKLPKSFAVNQLGTLINFQQTWEKIKDRLFAPKPGVSASKQITMVVMVPVLFVIIIVVFTRLFSRPSPQKTRPETSGTPAAVAIPDKRTDWQIPEPYPENLRDPMQIGSTAVESVSTAGLIVRGIAYSKDSPFAIIGSQIVKEGDKVLGATVIKINTDSVEFEINGERRIQKVQQ